MRPIKDAREIADILERGMDEGESLYLEGSKLKIIYSSLSGDEITSLEMAFGDGLCMGYRNQEYPVLSLEGDGHQISIRPKILEPKISAEENTIRVDGFEKDHSLGISIEIEYERCFW